MSKATNTTTQLQSLTLVFLSLSLKSPPHISLPPRTLCQMSVGLSSEILLTTRNTVNHVTAVGSVYVRCSKSQAAQHSV